MYSGCCGEGHVEGGSGPAPPGGSRASRCKGGEKVRSGNLMTRSQRGSAAGVLLQQVRLPGLWRGVGVKART